MRSIIAEVRRLGYDMYLDIEGNPTTSCEEPYPSEMTRLAQESLAISTNMRGSPEAIMLRYENKVNMKVFI